MARSLVDATPALAATLVATLALALGACGRGEPTDTSDRLPTILVTNATCEAGHCMTLEIRANIRKFLVPQPVEGLRVLGEVQPGRTCLTFPASWMMRVIGPDETGRVDTTITTWTPEDSLYLIAVDSTVFHGGGSPALVDSVNQGLYPFDGVGSGSVGETSVFVPGETPGWSVGFPSAPRWSARLESHATCTP